MSEQGPLVKADQHGNIEISGYSDPYAVASLLEMMAARQRRSSRRAVVMAAGVMGCLARLSGLAPLVFLLLSVTVIAHTCGDRPAEPARYEHAR